MKQVTIEHNMAIECITTMMRIAELDYFEIYIEEHKFIGCTKIKEKLHTLSNQLNSFEKNDLDILFKKFKLNFYYLILFITKTDVTTVNELLDKLKGLSSDEYLEECFRISSHDISIDDDDETVYEAVTERYSTEDAHFFIEFKNDTKLLHTKLLNIIESFYNKVFMKEEEWITREIEPILKNHIISFNENKKGFLDSIGNGNYEILVNRGKDVKINICYLEEFIPRYLFDKDTYIFVYGFGEEQKLKQKSSNINPQEIFKTLSDETRLRIISLLSQKKWARKDLVKEIGLTSATMTYQLNKLITLGLIELIVGGDSKKTLYTLNKDAFRTLVNSALDEIIL
ncbi:ArsR/SmtB family transcription factor [Oceanirhabdus seepicola]|uniref:Winged helix-turn-helix transcriptional regulator n=1 Tax=Oceanirhabdus seepicola TaxID=2828781 RepID=A0A9J6P6Z1_9CLOT|nr:winged helix-turn-helix domain-containing protein [Oceanirhabdus seepicola]MCM1992379.1 winged helix-turn-helix transcriptional regulator [Oceanirhabdus seepicola]